MALTLTGRSDEALQTQINNLTEKLRGLFLTEETLQSDLAGYDTEGYEYFKTHVLPREMVRLAEIRLTKIEPTDQFGQERIQGQQLECVSLMRRKQDIENELGITKRQIFNAKRERDGLQTKLTGRLE